MLRNLSRCFQPSSRLLVIAALLGALAACSPPPATTVRLPSGAKMPAVTDSAFVALVDSLAAAGDDIGLTCVIQYDEKEMPPHTTDIVPLEDTGHDAWIIWATARAARELIDDPNVRFVSEYRPEYKYNIQLAGADVAWVYVETFGGNQPEYRREIAELGVGKLQYISTPGYYYCKLSGEQVVALAESWWVRRIYRVRNWGVW